MKNPAWRRDEILLALDVYCKYSFDRLSASHTAIIDLSKLLNSLPNVFKEKRNSTFRNPKEVYMKMGHFLNLDPRDQRNGLPGYGKLDKIIFEEYFLEQNKLSLITKLIRETISDSDTLVNLLSFNNEEFYAKVYIPAKVVQRQFEGTVLLEANTLMRNRSKLALPYICRFSVFNRFTCPSVWPLLHTEPIAC